MKKQRFGGFFRTLWKTELSSQMRSGISPCDAAPSWWAQLRGWRGQPGIEFSGASEFLVGFDLVSLAKQCNSKLVMRQSIRGREFDGIAKLRNRSVQISGIQQAHPGIGGESGCLQ